MSYQQRTFHTLSYLIPQLDNVGGVSQEKLQERLRDQDSWISRLNQEADGLKIRLHQVEDSKQALQGNKQFREAQEKFENQISILENDKVSLMKRLNMVLSELEKATHEKSEVNAKLMEQERMADDLKRKLEEVSSLKTVVNRNLQEDLRYERELNDKLRDELNKFEREKEQLLNKLREQEELSKEITREASAINANLSRKNDELKKLERDHENNLNRLRDLNSQLDSLRQQEAHTKQEKRRMEDELEELTRERNELIRRMNELSDKYEEYVTTMNRERFEIMRANKNHVKLLTTKLFFQILSDCIQNRKKVGFSEIKGCSSHIKNMETKMSKFAKTLIHYGTEKKRRYLRLWYRNAMNFVHENYKKLNLIEFNVNKKQKIKFFYKWRSQYLLRCSRHEGKVTGLRSLRILLNSNEDYSLRKSLSKWRSFVQLRQLQTDFVSLTFGHKIKRHMRSAFVQWLAFTKKQGIQERYQNMSQLITELWYKQRVFLALRQASQEERTEKSINKFKAWKSWCENARKQKYFQRKKHLVQKIEYSKNDKLLRQCFDSIRYFNISNKYEDTKEQLDKEIPIRQDLEKRRDTMIKVGMSKEKYNLFRQCCIRLADAKYRALQIWKENIKFEKDSLKRMKLRIIDLHKTRLSAAFFKWKESIDKKSMVQLVTYTEDLMNENQELKNTMQACQQEREKLADCTGRQQLSKLERVRNMLDRHLVRRRFYQWAHTSQQLLSLEDALYMTSKTIRRRKLRNAFTKFRAQTQKVQRANHIEEKVQWFASVRAKKSLDYFLDQWKDYIKVQKQARKCLSRAMNSVDKSITNDAFAQWKKMVFNQKKQVYLNNIEELNKRKASHEQQIQDMNKQVQINESQEQHLLSKLQQQSHKIMANFISRSIHYQIAKGFYTWQDNLKDAKTKIRVLRQTMNYWLKNAQGKAFRQWSEFSLKSQERELAKNLQSKENERRNLIQLKDEEEKSQSNEIETLERQLKEETQTKDQLQANYEKALETHISRLKNNTYIDKRRNIFLTWVDFIKKEKNAVHVIGAIARKNLRMEVFSRIRLVARENFLDANAEKVLTKYVRVWKQRLLGNAFSKWRGKNYTSLVQSMVNKQNDLVELKAQQNNEMQNIETQKQKKAIKILKQKRQREIMNAWIKVIKVLKQSRIKQLLLNQNLKYLQQKYAVQKWHSRAEKTLYLRRRDDQVVHKYQLKVQKDILYAWFNRTQIEKQLCTRTVKFVKRLSFLDIAHGFYQILHYKTSLDERVKERKEHGNKTIYKTLNRIYKHKLADALLALKNRSYKKDFKENFLARTFKHSLTYRLRHFFGRWKHNKDRMELADKINSEGDVVVERNEVKRQVKALHDFLTTQGYTPEEISKYVQEKSEQQKQTMQRAVFGLFFNNSDFKIMPKSFNQWKRWVQIRKLCKQEAMFILNALRNPLFWPFRKWKYQEHHAKQKLREVPKKELVEKVIQDELALGSGQSKLARMNEAVEHLEIQRDNLLQHFISGQKLALSLGRNNVKKTLFRSFLRWKRFSKNYEQDRLAEQLARTNQMIADLMGHVNKLENINRGVVGENEELRQAALDGIEIAKAVQELTKEREQLSVDLQDRSSTIKKLIDDNNNLSLRLSVASKEAEQLETLNKQSYLAQPERDSYYR